MSPGPTAPPGCWFLCHPGCWHIARCSHFCPPFFVAWVRRLRLEEVLEALRAAPPGRAWVGRRPCPGIGALWFPPAPTGKVSSSRIAWELRASEVRVGQGVGAGRGPGSRVQVSGGADWWQCRLQGRVVPGPHPTWPIFSAPLLQLLPRALLPSHQNHPEHCCPSAGPTWLGWLDPGSRVPRKRFLR